MTANLAQLWLADPGPRGHHARAGARELVRDRRALVRHARGDPRCCSGRRPGIVISLLVAFSLVALVAAGTMLAASAHADVQRRLPAFGVQRALGFTPAAAGRRAGGRVGAARRARRRRSGSASERSRSRARRRRCSRSSTSSRPARRCCPCSAPAWSAITALVTARRDLARLAGGAPPAGRDPARRRPRARRRAPVAEAAGEARGGGRRSAARRRGRAPLRDGLLATGARFAIAARGRFAASVATIAVCAGVVTLMLALAALLERLRDDPGTVGKRYQLTVRLEPVRGRRGHGDPRRRRRLPSATRPTSPTRSGSASRCG